MTTTVSGQSAARTRPGPPPAPPGTVPAPGTPSAGNAARRWRGPLAVIAVIILGGAVTALLQPSAGTSGYLDPGDAHPYGARALATVLAQRGTTVTQVSAVAAAAAAAGQGPATLLITSPELLTIGQLRALARVPGDRVIVAPDPAVLAVLAPAVHQVRDAPGQPLAPACGLPAARLAGTADMGGMALGTSVAGAQQCYPSGGYPSLVRYAAAGRDITVLGTGAPLANSGLASGGNAALALNLLGGRPRVIWLVPSTAAPAGSGAAGQEPFTSIVPWPAYLVIIQLVIAAALAALWRARRLGPVVPERLPVVVRAAETVEGHGRLYRARRSRDRAAAVLRDAARGRMMRSLGVGGTPDVMAVAALLAARSRRSPDEITDLLAGPVPADDAALVALADRLDALEREVRIP
jgi:hypothetical protein